MGSNQTLTKAEVKRLVSRVTKEVDAFQHGKLERISSNTELGGTFSRSSITISRYIRQFVDLSIRRERAQFLRGKKSENAILQAVEEVNEVLSQYRRGEVGQVISNTELAEKYKFTPKTLRKYLKAGLTVSDFLEWRRLTRSVNQKGPLGSMYGRKHNAEAKRKMSESHKGEKNYWFGKKIPLEFRKKMSEAKKGKYTGADNHFFGKTHTEETRKRLSYAVKKAWETHTHPMLGKHLSDETKERLSKSKLGKKMTLETRRKMSSGRLGLKLSKAHRLAIAKGKQGEKNPKWAGGKSSHNQKLRTIPEYKAWRHAIFVRDNYTCRLCFQRGGYLEADHHPIAFAEIVNEIIASVGIERLIDSAMYHPVLWDINNGRTLCKKCHRLKS